MRWVYSNKRVGAFPASQMNNLYDDIQGNPYFNRLEVGDILFAEYTCPLDSKMFDVWTDCDYLVHVVSGKKIWHTADGAWPVQGGETLFFKKGAAVVEQFFETDFCVMIFFVPDTMVRDVVVHHLEELGSGPKPDESCKGAIPVKEEVGLKAFFESMKTYFSGPNKPTEPLLRLKLNELILNVLMSPKNPELAYYFRSLTEHDRPPLPSIMEANFRYNLSMEEFARLCHRSLSSFKRDFQKEFNDTPGRWILDKRLDFAAALLRSTEDVSITEILFKAGFENVSHFNKAFKKKFGVSPSVYRKDKQLT